MTRHFYCILFHKCPVIIVGAEPFYTSLAWHYPPLMRSQIAFILCYRIVFRPRHSICFGNNGLSSSLPKLPISAYQMRGYPEGLCCLIKGGLLSLHNTQMFWRLVQIYRDFSVLYWDFSPDRSHEVRFYEKFYCFSLHVNVSFEITNPLH